MEQKTDKTANQEEKPFDRVLEQFGDQMAAWGETFGHQMVAWGEEFGRHMETRRQEFERCMEAWGKEFGPRVKAWIKDLAQGMEQAGECVGEWFEAETTPPYATEAKGLEEERLAVLRMVAEGKISVAEAERMLRATAG